MADPGGRKAPPPRWILRLVWALDRARFRWSGGRLGLHAARAHKVGTLRLRTLGRHSGQERHAMLFYLADGANVAVVASNAGATTEPAWWLNLRASPEAYVDLTEGSYAVAGRAAHADEQDRLWRRFVEAYDAYADYAASADRDIVVVILEPSRAPTSRSSR